MSIVSDPARSCAPVRHGKARLSITINGQVYKLTRQKCLVSLGRKWALTHTSGPRAGVTHVVVHSRGTVACSCEDSCIHGSRCKHMRALTACGLISPRASAVGPMPFLPKGGAK